MENFNEYFEVILSNSSKSNKNIIKKKTQNTATNTLEYSMKLFLKYVREISMLSLWGVLD